jgi:hypothetical protein
MAESGPSLARRSRLQFSLRLLLLGLTTFAIGFPIWYRWPYEETEVVYFGSDKTSKPMGTITRTWQRKWGGGKVQSGRVVTETTGGPTKTIEHYVDGMRHGPYEFWRQGKLNRIGQYEHGKREGKWVDYGNGITYTAHWHQDRLHGPYVVESTDGKKKQEFEFDIGRLTLFDGQPVENRLLEKLESGAIDERRIAEELTRVMPVGMEFVETPLKDAVQYLQDQHNVPIVLDTRRIKDCDLPVTLFVKGVDLCSGMTLLTEPNDLAFDYRYGLLYLTTAENVKDWRDSTGVADIQPAAGSDMARAWNELTDLEAIESTLDAELQKLAQPLAIEIDTTRIAPSEDLPQGIQLTHNLKGLPFRQVLALLLDKTGCTCRLEGEKLVILPP